MIKFIKVVIFIYLLTFTVHAYGKSSEYYQATVVHALTQCNSSCQKNIFEKEVQEAVLHLFEAILNQLSYELSLKQKELYD